MSAKQAVALLGSAVFCLPLNYPPLPNASFASTATILVDPLFFVCFVFMGSSPPLLQYRAFVLFVLSLRSSIISSLVSLHHMRK